MSCHLLKTESFKNVSDDKYCHVMSFYGKVRMENRESGKITSFPTESGKVGKEVIALSLT